VFFAEDHDTARRTLHRLAQENYAIIYLTEQLAVRMESDIDRYKDAVMPAIILIPGRGGSLGLAEAGLQRSVERAVGADIS
jgi:V/A-type H+-transporting ATPase subunit F